MSLTSSSLKRLAFLAAAFAPVALVTGCANMVTTAPGTNSFTGAAKISGTLHGGNQPISGATVQIFTAGHAGYGSPGHLLTTVSSNNDASGSFSFTKLAPAQGTPDGTTGTPGTYSCPTNTATYGTDPQIYITASGGSTQGPNSPINIAAEFAIAIGPCSQVSSATFVDMNEVTTVATIAALQQYFNPAFESFGYANTTQSALGFANAVNTISNMVDVPTGVALTSKTLTGTASTVSGTVITVTPEQTKINTIANILAACVNTTSNTSDPCNTLFQYATPPASASLTSQPGATFATPADVLQAAYYMMINPTSGGTTGMTNLFTLAPPTSPFQPTLAANQQPTDWTLGINYNAGTAASAACTGSGAVGNVILYPYMVAADASGNIWVASNATKSATVFANLSEFSPNGTPLACTLGSTMSQIEGLTIDTAGNVWAAGHTAGGIAKVDPNTLSATTWTEASITPWAIAADGTGNVFYTTSAKTVREFTGAASGSPAAATLIGGATNSAPNFMAIDGSSRIWVGEASTAGGLFEYYPDSNVADSPVGGYVSANVDAGNLGSYNDQGILAIDSTGKVWTAESNSRNIMSNFTPGANGTATNSFLSPAYSGGLNSGRGVAIDGAGNVWVPNGVSQNGTTPMQAVTEYSNSGSPLSPTGGTATAAGTNGGFQKPSTVFPSTLRGVTIDPSGNVWMGTNSSSGTSISEIVGAAVPVITPLSAQVAQNKLGTKP